MQRDQAASPPVCHIVMWDIAGETPAEKQAGIDTVKREFESLRGQIDGMTRLVVGVDVSRIDYARDVVLVTEFESQAALEAYAAHPAHLAVRDRLGSLRIARHQVDYLLSPEDVMHVDHR